MNQLDIFDDDPARKAYANRVAADTALHDPHFPSAAEREMRQPIDGVDSRLPTTKFSRCRFALLAPPTGERNER